MNFNRYLCICVYLSFGRRKQHGHCGGSGLEWTWGTGREGKRRVERMMGKVETKGDGGCGKGIRVFVCMSV